MVHASRVDLQASFILSHPFLFHIARLRSENSNCFERKISFQKRKSKSERNSSFGPSPRHKSQQVHIRRVFDRIRQDTYSDQSMPRYIVCLGVLGYFSSIHRFSKSSYLRPQAINAFSQYKKSWDVCLP